jgi:periplasmic protein TonB
VDAAAAAPPDARLGGWLGVSLVLHAGVLSALAVYTAHAPAAGPPIYRVDIVAAPPGPRTAGVVTPPPPTPAPPANITSPEAPAPPPPVPRTAPQPMTAPGKAPATRQPTRATPTSPTKAPSPPTGTRARPAAPAAPPPRAGGGPTGGEGTDVATVRTAGIDFPFPGYLNNIVRQVALNFSPDNAGTLRAEVAFLIRRDGTVAGFRFITRSGDYGFDLEAQGAIEKAAPNFGPLPQGFTEDVLPVLFSFDPRLIR